MEFLSALLNRNNGPTAGDQAPDGQAPDKGPESPDRRKIFKGLGAAALVLAAGASGCKEASPFPTFQLVDQDGNPVKSEDLKDSICIYSFGFTGCSVARGNAVCPNNIWPALISLQMAIEEKAQTDPWYKKVKILTFTSDPAVDRGAYLKRYTEDNFRPNKEIWRFLTSSDGPERAEQEDQLFEVNNSVAVMTKGNPVGHSSALYIVDGATRKRLAEPVSTIKDKSAAQTVMDQLEAIRMQQKQSPSR